MYENLAGEQKDDFTVGIVDDVTFKSLPINKEIMVLEDHVTEALFFGLGSDGTIGANKIQLKSSEKILTYMHKHTLHTIQKIRWFNTF